jgi:tetratricopeptide (TPR) repeat protein
MRLLEEFIAESEAGSRHYLDPTSYYLRASMRLAFGDLMGASVDSKRALEGARRAAEGQLLGIALLGQARVLLEQGREQGRDEASALVREALDFGDRLIYVLNDAGIVHGAWIAHDLGLGDAYRALAASAPDIPWVRAATAICSGDFGQAAEVLEEIGYRPGEAYARLRAAKELVEAGRRAEADAQLQRALAFWREVGATRYVREGEALLAASA